ncbi:hypothetical protein SKAU_G00180800 [Synaphobranchus kaupii]|uniref:Uncharacterized protein n=1 Tax=Synaphobranchus kaupii TaxID=118154 RepID=A0A9Q1FMA8_SYNKA|nr:hypothetical protein SKAU_G00180800 [Synaphobranchus kaupii]
MEWNSNEAGQTRTGAHTRSQRQGHLSSLHLDLDLSHRLLSDRCESSSKRIPPPATRQPPPPPARHCSTGLVGCTRGSPFMCVEIIKRESSGCGLPGNIEACQKGGLEFLNQSSVLKDPSGDGFHVRC